MTRQHLDRRTLLKSSALAGASLALSPFLRAALAQDPTPAGPKKKILFFTKSAGFQHPGVTRKNADSLGWAEQILSDLGAKNNFDITCSKDGNLFAPGSIEQFDAFAFYTTGDLTQPSDKYAVKKDPNGRPVEDKSHLLYPEPAMPKGAKQAFLDAIKNGKGFIGFHSATDTFHSPNHVKGKVDLHRDVDQSGHDDFDPYIAMIGGEFVIHGQQQKATLHCVDPNFPGAKDLDNAQFVEEWYSLKNFAPDLHVILTQDCTGMHGPMYQRPPYPETWARMHGKGRVFYTSMGHRQDVWNRPDFQALTLGALNWITSRADHDITPNIQQATPDANVPASAS